MSPFWKLISEIHEWQIRVINKTEEIRSYQVAWQNTLKKKITIKLPVQMKRPYLRSGTLHNVTGIIMQNSSKTRKLYWSAAKVTECRRHFPWRETTSMKRLFLSRKKAYFYILATLIIVRRESENRKWDRWLNLVFSIDLILT